MSKTEKIIQLFSNVFDTGDFYTRGEAHGFKCPCMEMEECSVNKDQEPIWSSCLGDEDTNVMIVAEAPSSKGGTGPHIAGLVENWNDEETVNSLFRFVRAHFNTIPYFTDLMKCGVERQTKNAKRIFKKRIANCVSVFLLKEIRLIKPKIILCVGVESYNALIHAKEIGKIDGTIELVKLIHYGKQANLPLTSSDKENIIWPFQVGKINTDKIKDIEFFSK